MAWPECTTRCRSLQHALDVISVVTRGSEQQIKAFLSLYCCNATTLKDDFGRNVVHMSASCGKKDVLEWLAAKGMDLAVKDKESGWTALHRSIFYGHIDCALTLLKVNFYTTYLQHLYLYLFSAVHDMSCSCQLRQTATFLILLDSPKPVHRG